MKKTHLIILILAAYTAAQDPVPSFATGWAGRVAITTDNTKITTSNPIPAYFDLDDIDPADTFWQSVSSTGAEIRMGLSGGSTSTQVSCHVVTIDTTAKTGQIWYDASKNSTSVDVTYYIYAGKSGESAPAEDAAFGRESVYSPSGCVGAWHLNGASVTDLDDATSYDLDFITENNTVIYDAEGKHGTGVEFDTGNEYIRTATFGSSPDLAVTNIATMGWIQIDDTIGDQVAFSFQYDYSNGLAMFKNADDPKARIDIPSSGIADILYATTHPMSVGTWYHLACFGDNTNRKLYQNASQVATAAATGAMGVATDKAVEFGAGIGGSYFHGHVDTVLLFTGANATSEEFVTTCYNNQKDSTYYSNVAAWEPLGGEVSTPTPSILYFP